MLFNKGMEGADAIRTAMPVGIKDNEPSTTKCKTR